MTEEVAKPLSAKVYLLALANSKAVDIVEVEDTPDIYAVHVRTRSESGLDILLGFQNGDVLNIGIGSFWSSWFPYPDVSEKFESVLSTILENRAAIRTRTKFGRTYRHDLVEIGPEGDLSTLYRCSELTPLTLLPVPARVGVEPLIT